MCVHVCVCMYMHLSVCLCIVCLCLCVWVGVCECVGVNVQFPVLKVIILSHWTCCLCSFNICCHYFECVLNSVAPIIGSAIGYRPIFNSLTVSEIGSSITD